MATSKLAQITEQDLRDHIASSGPELRRQYPKIYGFLGGLAGTAPDEFEGSVLDPISQAVKEGASYGFPIGVGAAVAPFAKGIAAAKGLATGGKAAQRGNMLMAPTNRLAPQNVQALEQAALKSYTPEQRAALQLWGDTMYLDQHALPSGPGNLRGLANDFAEYSTARSAGDSESASDLAEWFAEGASKGRVPHLTREAYDSLLQGAERTLTEPLTVYRSGSTYPGGWSSTTLQKGAYEHLGPETAYTLPAGSPVIFASGLADKGEVIVRANLLKGSPVTNKLGQR